MNQEIKDLSLYVHIPFCKAKCHYCDFLSFGGMDYAMQREYVDALCKEIAAYRAVAQDYMIRTIFFGGGTPSYIEANLIVQIMDTIQSTFTVASDAEITMEGNPDSLLLDKLKVYAQAGVNRLSIGLQSVHNEMLAKLGRVHSYEQFLEAFQNAREAGFQNINVDVMSGLPGETMESYMDTLQKVIALQPEHISAYSLIVEEDTPLSENEALLDTIPSEEEDRAMYAKTKKLLLEHGYYRYEISNYAKSGFACKHNQVYWTGGEYLGVGLSAASYMTVYSAEGQGKSLRFHGVEDIREYIGRFSRCEGMWGLGEEILYEFVRDFYRDLHFCRRKDEMEEFMFLGLRMMEGVSKTEYRKRFGVEMEFTYGAVLEKYKKQGLLLEDATGDRVFLSEQGIDVSNVVMADFML
ncbi:MAG: radical SAM family heme chaperone HemW [Eubacteriales bacterium]|nr:radical SAM family heme chaperone HemW [Eubacteriales bacterium]